MEVLCFAVPICCETVWSVSSMGKLLIENVSLNGKDVLPGREWEMVVTPSANYAEFADIFAGKCDNASLEEVRVMADGGITISINRDGKESVYGVGIGCNPVFDIVAFDDNGYLTEKYTIAAEPHKTSIFKYVTVWASGVEHVCRRIDLDVEHTGYMHIMICE